MGIKKYSGKPGIDGRFPSVQDAKYIGSGKPPYLDDCIAWFSNNSLDYDTLSWKNEVYEDSCHWKAERIYSQNEIVVHYVVYNCIVESSQITDPGNDSASWTIAGYAWDDTTTYNTDDYCYDPETHLTWSSKIDSNIGNAPPKNHNSDDNWQSHSLGSYGYNWLYIASLLYNTDNHVLYPHVYSSISNNNQGNEPTGVTDTYWTKKTSSIWITSATYNTDDIVIFNGSVWQSTADNNITIPYASGSSWTELAKLKVPHAKCWNSTRMFAKGTHSNGLPYAKWSRGGDDNLDYPSVDQAWMFVYPDFSFCNLEDLTMVVVMKGHDNAANWGNNHALFGRYQNIGLQITSDRYYSMIDCSGDGDLSINIEPHSKPVILSLGWCDDDSAYLRYNGIEMDSVDSGNNGYLSQPYNHTLGINVVNSSDWYGQANLFDLLLYNRKLSSTEIAYVENFLMGKWGIEKLQIVTVSAAGNSDGVGAYTKGVLSAVTLANNIAAYDGDWNTMYTFDKYLQYNSTLEKWELWHDFTEDYGPLPSGAVEGPEMQYVVSALFSMTDDMMGNTHYLLYNATDGQWEFWMFNEWYGEEKDMYQALLTYVASGTADTVPTSGWSNVSGISSFDTTPTLTTNF